MHFLDVPSWTDPVQLGIRDKKGGNLSQGGLPDSDEGSICCCTQPPILAELPQNCHNELTHPQPAFHLYCHHSSSLCLSTNTLYSNRRREVAPAIREPPVLLSLVEAFLLNFPKISCTSFYLYPEQGLGKKQRFNSG